MSLHIATTAFIANTDFGWFSHFLHRAEPPDEVNFWHPSPPGFKAIPAGAPFFFRLGAPHRAIAGYGFFARYERVPVWLACESFGDPNGTDTFAAEMTAHIAVKVINCYGDEVLKVYECAMPPQDSPVALARQSVSII